MHKAWWIGGAALGLALTAASCQRDTLFGSARHSAYDTGLRSYVAGQRAWLERDTVTAADYYLAVLARDRDNDILRQRTFQLLVSDGRFDEAMPLARDLPSGSAAYGVARMLLALDAIKAHDYAAALDRLDQVVGTGFDSLLRPIARAWALAGLARTDEALAALEVLDNMPPLSVFGREHGALIQLYAGQWDDAEARLRPLIDSRAASVRTVHDYAAWLSRHGQMTEALAVLEPWLEGNPRLATLLADRDR
ncbi:MAG: hypothetical protein D6782_11395, partial [Alphaproteobacteria bacterium]